MGEVEICLPLFLKKVNEMENRFKTNKELKSKNPFSKFVVDEGWEEIQIKSGVKQINEELEERKNEQSNDTTNISESKSD